MEKSPEPKKRNFRIIGRIIGGALIIGAVLGGAEYFSHRVKTTNQDQNNQETPAEVVKLIDNPPKNSPDDSSVAGSRINQNGVEEDEKSWLAQTPNGTSVNISIFYVLQRKDHKTILEPNQVNMTLSANANTNNFEVAYGLVEVNGKWTYNYAQYLSSNYPNQITIDGSQIQSSSQNSDSRFNTTFNNKKEAQVIDKKIISGMISTMQNIFGERNDNLKPIGLTQK